MAVAAPPPQPAVVVRKDGPGLLLRFLWWVVVGWWASFWAIAIAWLALVTIVGIPLGIWIINRLPTILTLRPRTRNWVLGQDAAGRTVISEVGRSQPSWVLRGIWFLLIGWWASGLWMVLSWLISVTVVGLPLALLMFNRTPFIASLYRY